MSASGDTDSTSMSQILHPRTCTESPEDFIRMADMIKQDPESLYRQRVSERGQIVSGAITPLLSSIYQRHSKCVEFLLKNGSQPNHYDTGCFSTPLYFTMFVLFREERKEIISQLEDIVEILLKKGASPYLPNVRYLINTETKDISKSFYIETAVKSGSIKLLKLLLDYNCTIQDLKLNSLDVLECRSGKGAPIVNTIRLKNIIAFKLLLLHGASFEFYYDISNQPFSCPLVILHVYRNEISKGDIDDCLKFIKIYINHGGIMYSRSDVPNILEVLQKNNWLKVRNLDFEDIIQNLMQNPLSLKQLCRIHLKKQFGTEYVKNISLLPLLPREVLDYLYFSNL